MPSIQVVSCLIIFLPLIAALIVGITNTALYSKISHSITIGGVGIAFVLTLWLTKLFFFDHHLPVSFNLFIWAKVTNVNISVGFLVDKLTVFMMLIVTFVSLLVHIYSVGYMRGDAGYRRFFSYISAFTFAMLALVSSNNFLVLFFGWEAVGLVSYLLIGFWFKKDTANHASFKAFLVNRVGDLGFLLGIACVMMYFNTLDYGTVFSKVQTMSATTIHINQPFNMVTVLCLLLFAGAMGKSAQIPLHVWLEGSMEGPTPISALIHAATMVTAGVFMLARLSPIFEASSVALNVIMLTGSITCLFMGLLAIVQNDIKRVVAYSTLSQLGYMVAAQGASAYTFGMFHLMTHACFKALLFLGAGSVILAMHHEQDIRKMGALRKSIPITYWCMLVGCLALVAIPPFSGFFSKELIIDAVTHSSLPSAKLAGFFVTAGAFVTAIYTFRMFFVVFHGKSNVDKYTTVKEPSRFVLLPLILLAIPSVLAGIVFFHSALSGFFANSIHVLASHNPITNIFHGHIPSSLEFIKEGLTGIPLWISIFGIFISWLFYAKYPQIPAFIQKRCFYIFKILQQKYFFDTVYDFVFVRGSRLLGTIFWRAGDQFLIDSGIVKGSGKSIYQISQFFRRSQTGYLYHYVLFMLLGLLGFLGWLLLS
ncbi:MAG: NADH-quinone oxidoreductase subunit L [Thiotrichales bacterium]|nr:MAG: NADH-quinone oxidoreductase subunit L [Thiotrichales bacterium]